MVHKPKYAWIKILRKAKVVESLNKKEFVNKSHSLNAIGREEIIKAAT